jgi:signal transduction histidine kinase/CheY-like chemotaxis protein
MHGPFARPVLHESLFALQAFMAISAATFLILGAAVEERRRVEERLRVAHQTVAEANRAKTEFLAVMSHELRTPLNAISGYVDLMTMEVHDPVTPTQRTYLARIQSNQRHLLSMIDDVLSFAKVETGRLTLGLESVRVGDVLTSLESSIEPEVQRRALSFTCDPCDPALIMRVDPDKLRQVLLNLLANAVKFTPKGGKVQVRLERVNSHVEVSVSDTGIGIAPEFIPHLFQQFRQADASVSREYGGLGLGLALVRYIAELHGGQVAATSEGVGKGSTFRVALPVMIMRPDATSSEDSARKRQEAARRLAGYTVLAIDDDPDSLLLLSDVLQAAGATVVRATSGPEALDLLDRHSPNVIVADLGMPTMDGYQFIRAVRQRDHRQGGAIPAAALTAYARPEDRTAALRAGFQLHLAKPIDPEELVAAISALGGHNRLTNSVV